MLKSDRIRDYMATELVTVTPDTEILRAARLLVDNNIGGVPVMDAAGRLAGILTEKDLMQVVLNASYYADYGGLVADYMTTVVETIGPDESVVAVAKRFLDKRYHRYPVVENGRLVGQISRRDLLRALSDLW
ncbi:MAG: CBS domain-containing protein [Chromatiales bacterium]|jgi:CBS domain-containing protein|nr:MAG: CBS domain-containing protein [Chromatiales bacterium]